MLAAELSAAREALDEARRPPASGESQATDLLARQLEQLREAEEARSVLAAELSAARQALEEVRRPPVSVDSQSTDALKELEAELKASRERTRAAEEEADLLLLQLHQVQEELEQHYLARRRGEEELARLRDELAVLEKRRSEQAHARRVAERKLQTLARASEAAAAQQRRLSDARAASGRLVLEGISVGSERLVAPHFHLGFKLRGLRLGPVSAGESSARLVEHRGFPGLVLFGDEGQPHWLSSWQESGREGPLPYLTVMPCDAASRARLDVMPGRDWLAVISLIEQIGARLDQADSDVALRWRDVAARLLAQLQELEPRLRYDGLVVSPPAAEHEGGRRIDLHGVVFGARRFDRVSLWLRPGAAAGDLELLADSSGRLPVYAVTADDSGDMPKHWPLGFGGGRSSSERARWWASVTPGDRDFVVAMLAALSGAVGAAGDATGLNPRERDAILAAARNAAKLAAGTSTTRRLIRGISRRVGAGGAR